MPQSSTPRGGGWLAAPLGVIKFDNGRVSFFPLSLSFSSLAGKTKRTFLLHAYLTCYWVRLDVPASAVVAAPYVTAVS